MPFPRPDGSDVPPAASPPRHTALVAVLVAALGYFVDIYDVLLFSVVRIRSLSAIGVPAADLLSTGVHLLNMQMLGMLIGGVAWGVLGDRRGRLSVLFGSIIVYSIANLLNALVTSVEQYAVLRFIAGIGLAGELGAGITLVSELVPRHQRGYATGAVAGIGLSGAIAAVVVGDLFDWRAAYAVGGVMGLLLLVLRLGVRESGLFEAVTKTALTRGRFLQLFATRERATRYLAVIAVGIPIWYVVAILITFSPEFGRTMGIVPAPTSARAILFAYIGLSVGDLASGALSQVVASRKRVLRWFLSLTTLGVAAYFLPWDKSPAVFYALCGALGVATGYWAVFVTVAAEQFGTNLRATATTTAPNFVRGAVVPITSGFQALAPTLGLAGAGALVGAVVLAVAFLALARLPETHGRDLDFVEH
ncbi:MAG: MFS transporter [Acidobacteria bacterium]|nr:MFS transporter [Acidobacteriota bacterium]